MKSSTEQEIAGESRREEERGGYSQVGITWMMQRDDTPLRNSLTDAGEGRMKQRQDGGESETPVPR